MSVPQTLRAGHSRHIHEPRRRFFVQLGPEARKQLPFFLRSLERAKRIFSFSHPVLAVLMNSLPVSCGNGVSDETPKPGTGQNF
jgi:hypothetical protein